MKRLSLLISFVLLLATGYAQHPKKAVKAYEAAEQAFQKRDHQRAYQQVVKALVEDPNYAEAWLLEGEIGMETKDFDMAILGYEKALSSDSMVFPPAAVTLARLYDMRGQYKREKALLGWYQSKHFNSQPLDGIVTEMLEVATFRDESVSHPVPFAPETLGNTVNTLDDEYVNMLSFDGQQLLFTRKMPADNGYQKEALFIAEWMDGQWNEPQPLSFVDFPEDVDPGAAFISADGKKLYLTGCGWGRDGNCDLYVSECLGRQWSRPKRLSENINTRGWESQPCVSSDGRELFFVSRRNGNADIYRCLRNADGSWGSPQNLGEPVNTKGTEMAPFLHPDGRTLYFSSDKHIGMGGFDLFMSRRGEDGQWGKPVNLGFPINTQGDEINFFVASDGKTAFISSMREGGRGGYDIYSFELPEEIRSDSANYLSTVDVIELAPGDAVVLQNIQFEFNSSELTADSQSGIQMIVDFLQRNPDLNVELAGHTDNVGSDTYNLKLSSERAEIVKKALIDKGIAADRLESKGYGATKPLMPNDSDEHRALNRRTEMIVK
ncbi:MAG: PD40 domain-containing protein [Bacteroidales bacterium]|nr:PD40 domain-containing protein [Bacteroidales bacterium]